MSLNPLNELKRRLEDETTPLPKRLCLAKNLVHSHHFPAAPKERVVADWLEGLSKENRLEGDVIRNVTGWLNTDLTGELKGKLVQVISLYLQKNSLQDDYTQCILAFLENENVSTQLTHQIDDYLQIVITLLQYLNSNETKLNEKTTVVQRILNNIVKYYKECKKKLEFIIKLLNGKNIEILLSYLNTDCHNSVINVSQNVLFPLNKKSFFISFLQTLIRKDNIDDLVAKKGDNIQSVLKIMSAFFTFPNGRINKDYKFLVNFINVFVSCFKNESQLIFAFYIMVVNLLNMEQSYLAPAMKMPAISFNEHDEKIKRKLFLNMLKILNSNDVDINVRLTDTFGEKISKVEIKKNFMTFLQTTLLGQLKLDGKLDELTLQIIQTALLLDPALIEQKMVQILSPIMASKKHNSKILETYKNTINCLLEILFKLSRGSMFINQILPHVKLYLEGANTEQFELKQKIKTAIDNNDKLKNRLITGNDVFPEKCVEMYGKFTSELMFRQNKDVLVTLQKDLEEHCLMMLEEGFVSPSIITLAEVLSAILSSFLRHNKMADHSVPLNIAEEFWEAFKSFESECLKKFGECLLKLSYDPSLTRSFLNLCCSVAQLKLLNIKYSNVKLPDFPCENSDVNDMTVILPCLNSEQWKTVAGKVEGEECVVLDDLLLLKTVAFEIQNLKTPTEENIEAISSTKTQLITNISQNLENITQSGHFARVLFHNLERSQLKNLAKNLVKLYLAGEFDFTENDAVTKSRELLNAIVIEIARNICKLFDNFEDFAKSISKTDFDIAAFMKERDIKEYINQITLKDDMSIIVKCTELLKILPVEYLEEKYQLVTIFVLLISKLNAQKKLKKSIDTVLLKIYELSPKYPDLFKVFPVEYMFSFDDQTILNLLTLRVKNCNNIVIKSVLETAVKKVKTDPEIVKAIVELLLSQKHNKSSVASIEYFSDPAFQISCIILPIVAKERKNITTSAYRSILANLQEKIHKNMLDSFKNIDFSNSGSFSVNDSGNLDESVLSDNTLATLNAVGAYSLTLARYCGTTNAEEVKNLDYLWSSMDFFVQNAIHSIQNPASKNQHVESSLQLLNVVLRSFKKLESHAMFQEKDKLFIQIWKSLLTRLNVVFERNGKRIDMCQEEMAIAVKFVCELMSVDCFIKEVIGELSTLSELKKPSEISKPDSRTTISHKVSKFIWTHCLKANIVGQKCVSLAKLFYKTCKNLRVWIQQNFEIHQDVVNLSTFSAKVKNDEETDMGEGNDLKTVCVGDEVCELVRIDLDAVTEAILEAKKVTLDYKSLDAIFDLQHLTHYVIGRSTLRTRCEVSWDSYFKLYDACIGVLNGLLVSREELLEDRWPCYMQCYRALVTCLCERSTSHAQLDRSNEDKLAELAYSVEKLTQSICKRKNHVSRIAAYTVADICALLETNIPCRMVRQHLENSIALLIQASDNTYAMAFLRRALAGTNGHTTVTNMYTMYKRYHKYVGNA